MSNSNAVKLHRQRKAGKAEPLKSCPQCGKQVRTQNHGGLCSRCWYKTEEGKANSAARTRKHRSNKKG